jgi:hypothetical protein
MNNIRISSNVTLVLATVIDLLTFFHLKKVYACGCARLLTPQMVLCMTSQHKDTKVKIITLTMHKNKHKKCYYYKPYSLYKIYDVYIYSKPVFCVSAKPLTDIMQVFAIVDRKETMP